MRAPTESKCLSWPINQLETNHHQGQISQPGTMSQNQQTTLFQRLPAELLLEIVRAACDPAVDDDLTTACSPLHGVPNLTSIANDPRVQQIQWGNVLPDSLVFVVQQRTCDACEMETHAPGSYAVPFADVRQAPFDSFLQYASAIIVTIRCRLDCGNAARDTESIAFYSPRNSLNLLALSRIAMLNSQQANFIDIHCAPRSHAGALMIMEFLRQFSPITYGLARGHVSFDSDTYSPIRFMEVLTLAADLEQTHLSWASAMPSQQIFLREAQRLLDQRLVPIHKFVPVAMAGFRALEVLHSHQTPTVNQAGFVWPPEILDFTTSCVLRSTFASITFQGLARRLLQQNCERDLQYANIHLKPKKHVTLVNALGLIKGVCSTYTEMTLLQPPYQMTARCWTIEDLPYLLFISAMFQTYIILRIAFLRATRYGQSIHQVVGVFKPAYIDGFNRCWSDMFTLEEEIETLAYLDNEIQILQRKVDAGQLGGFNQAWEPPFPLEPHYNHAEIQEFVDRARRIMYDMSFHEVGYFDEQGEMVDTDVFYDPIDLGPEIFQIPMIPDWRRMAYTFDFLNYFGLLHPC